MQISSCTTLRSALATAQFHNAIHFVLGSLDKLVRSHFPFNIDPTFKTTITFITIDDGETTTFQCERSKPLVGQFVSVQMVGVEGSLSLCEVEIFSGDGGTFHYPEKKLDISRRQEVC